MPYTKDGHSASIYSAAQYKILESVTWPAAMLDSSTSDHQALPIGKWMAKKAAKNTDSSANLGFEAKLWLAADYFSRGALQNEN